jgi:hypothetical protein
MALFDDARRTAGFAIAFGLMIAVAAVYWYVKYGDDEPYHAGRPLRAWIRDLRFAPTDETEKKAAAAVRAIGPPALPGLREALEEEKKLPLAAPPGEPTRSGGFIVRVEILIRQIESQTAEKKQSAAP